MNYYRFLDHLIVGHNYKSVLSCRKQYHVEKEIKKSKTITSNECTFQYCVKRRIVKQKVV